MKSTEFSSGDLSEIVGAHEAGASWGGNMLPAMFLPILYIPLANWLSEIFGKLL